MKRIIALVISMVALTQLSAATPKPAKTPPAKPIVHSVFFRLKHAAGSPQESAFLAAARQLAKIPTVKKFRCLREVSPKNKFDFGLSMEFKDQVAYDTYNQHPDHVKFVQEIWLKEVEEFMEIDYVVLPGK